MAFGKRKINRFPSLTTNRPIKPGVTRYGTTEVKPKRTHPFVRKAKRILSIAFTIGIISVIIYAFFFSNYFLAKQITFAENELGNEFLQNEIKKTIDNSLGKNLITTDTEDLETAILSAFPQLEQIKVKKHYPSTITIEFSEYPLVANIISESPGLKKNYIVNSIGYTMKEDYEDPNLPYIRIQSEEPINPDSPAIEAGKLKIILDTIVYFQDKFGMRVVEVRYRPIAREIHLITERSFAIWLDIQKSTEDQLKKLKKVLVKLDIYTENLEYIDLRIAGGSGDKIIYKRKQ